MTGLLNRRALDEAPAVEVTWHEPQADPLERRDRRPRRTEAVTDTAGHAAGAELILLMATVLTSTSGGHDAVARSADPRLLGAYRARH